jgi:hypothetical protein
MTIKFSIGDIIHQKRDNVVYVVEDMSRARITVGFYSKASSCWESMTISKKQLSYEFSTRGDLLEIIKVKKPVKKTRETKKKQGGQINNTTETKTCKVLDINKTS